MISPLKFFENSYLSFQIPTGKTTFNNLGNRVVGMEPLTLRAKLNPLRDSAQVSQYVGDDETAELMQGYLTFPLILPAALKTPAEGRARIEVARGRWEEGDFELKTLTQSAYKVKCKIDYLNKIIGVFRRS